MCPSLPVCVRSTHVCGRTFNANVQTSVAQRNCVYFVLEEAAAAAAVADSYARWRSTRFAILLLSLRFFFSFRFSIILHYATEHVNVNKWDCLMLKKQQRKEKNILNFDGSTAAISFHFFSFVFFSFFGKFA